MLVWGFLDGGDFMDDEGEGKRHDEGCGGCDDVDDYDESIASVFVYNVYMYSCEHLVWASALINAVKDPVVSLVWVDRIRLSRRQTATWRNFSLPWEFQH
jgi:hypothetical protein